jgi:hypothetical protein
MVIQETGTLYPVFYIESGLHNNPDSLRKRIQEEIDRIENVDVILMAFGFCGNSMLGIRSPEARLVIPKVDDCIPLLLGSCEERKKISKEMGTYFLTKGWLDYESNLIREYERCVMRYGDTRALKVMKIMLGNYRRFMVIDTGAYQVECVTPRTQEFAEKLNKLHEITAGSMRYLRKLLLGPWDEEFMVVEPGQEISLSDICIQDNPEDFKQLLCNLDR